MKVKRRDILQLLAYSPEWLEILGWSGVRDSGNLDLITRTMKQKGPIYSLVKTVEGGAVKWRNLLNRAWEIQEYLKGLSIQPKNKG